MLYEDIIIINKQNKDYLKELINAQDNKQDKEELLLAAKFRLCEIKGSLFLINGKERKILVDNLRPILTILFSKSKYISNISFLLKYGYILDTYELENQFAILLVATLRTLRNSVDIIEFKRIKNIKVEQGKTAIMNTKVLLQYHDTVLVVQNKKTVYVYSDCLLRISSDTLFSFNGLGCKVLKIDNIDFTQVKNMGNMFSQCNYLEKLILNNFNTSNVDDMSNFFYSCTALKDLDISCFDTRNVVDFSYMFCGCRNLRTLNLNKLNMKKSTKFVAMFKDCISLTHIDMHDCQSCRGKIINMTEIFTYCLSLKYVDMVNFVDKEQDIIFDYALFNCPDNILIKGLEGRF